MKTPYDVPHLPGAYLIVDDNNEKAYVGSTGDLRTRMLRHNRELNNGTHYNAELQEHHEKNELNFIALAMEDKEQALNFEQSVLDCFHDTPVLCNKAIDAREAGKNFVPSISHRAKLRQANLGRPKSEDHKKAISQTLTGRKLSPEHAEKVRVATLGKPKSEEHKQKISEANKGRVFSEETRRKMAEAKKDYVFTDEHRQKLSESAKGRPISEKTREIFDESRKQPVIVNSVEYPSITDARLALGLTPKAITYRLNSDKYPEFKRIDHE